MPFVVIYSHENGDANPPAVMIHTDACPHWAAVIKNDPPQNDWVTLPKFVTFQQARDVAQHYVRETGAKEWLRGRCAQ